MNQLLASLSRFNRQEQIILLLGAVLVSILLIWLLLLSPLQSKRDRLLAINTASTQSLGRVQLLVRQVENLSQQSVQAGTGNEDLSGLINSSLSENGLTMTGLQPGSGGEARVRIDKASSDSLLQWLFVLENKHRITIRDLTITATNAPGQVAVNVRLLKP
ncbi:MAG: type II secretion system protein GspM [Pseudomonadota bacterium]